MTTTRKRPIIIIDGRLYRYSYLNLQREFMNTDESPYWVTRRPTGIIDITMRRGFGEWVATVRQDTMQESTRRSGRRLFRFFSERGYVVSERDHAPFLRIPA